jgi:hypothetical protein
MHHDRPTIFNPAKALEAELMLASAPAEAEPVEQQAA